MKSLRILFYTLFAASLSVVSQQSVAAVATFDDFIATPSGNGSADIGNSFTSGGYVFAQPHNLVVVVNPTLCSFGGCVDNGTHYAAFGAASGGLWGPVTMSKAGGGEFSLLSFDGSDNFLSNINSVPNSWGITVVGHKSNGDTIYTFFGFDLNKDGAGGVPDFQEFYFASEWTNLNSAEWFGGKSFGEAYGWAAIDNVEAVGTIPEPVTLALLALGLAGVGFSRRKPLSSG